MNDGLDAALHRRAQSRGVQYIAEDETRLRKEVLATPGREIVENDGIVLLVQERPDDVTSDVSRAPDDKDFHVRTLALIDNESFGFRDKPREHYSCA
jgi:hypothetical protein